MAILWHKHVNGTHYEIRTAGQTRRLYTDGVFHSQFNPNRPVTGGVWDLLLLPAFFYPAGDLQRILVLGVGGGAVIRQLLHFIRPAAITGVELNSVHLYAATRFFGAARRNVVLHHADAVRWMQRYRGPKFDMIIDDLFGEADGEPVRAVQAERCWCHTLRAHLAPNGVLVANFISTLELRHSAYVMDRDLSRRFKAAFQLTTPLNENAIGAFLRMDANRCDLRNRLRATPGLNPELKTSRLSYRIRRI